MILLTLIFIGLTVWSLNLYNRDAPSMRERCKQELMKQGFTEEAAEAISRFRYP